MLVPLEAFTFDYSTAGPTDVGQAWMKSNIWSSKLRSDKCSNLPDRRDRWDRSSNALGFHMMVSNRKAQDMVGFIVPGFWDGMKRMSNKGDKGYQGHADWQGYFNLGTSKISSSSQYEIQNRQAHVNQSTGTVELAPWNSVFGYAQESKDVPDTIPIQTNQYSFGNPSNDCSGAGVSWSWNQNYYADAFGSSRPSTAQPTFSKMGTKSIRVPSTDLTGACTNFLTGYPVRQFQCDDQNNCVGAVTAPPLGRSRQVGLI